MLSYSYTARDTATGKKVKAEVQADSLQAASKLIKEQGYTPLSITVTGANNPLGKFTNKVGTKDKILFSRQLSTLINAGLPLVQSLRTVADQTQSKPLKTVITTIIADVEAGSALSKALEKHPKVFNQIYISLVAAGETSGTLDKALERLAQQQEKDAEIMGKVKGAMVYPIIVLLVMVGVVGFMIVKVLPQVEVLYEGMPDAELPLVTRVLLSVSHALISYWWIALVLAVVAAIFTSKWARTVAGKRTVDTLKMRAWPIAPLFMKLYMARFARTGATLIASGVPLLQVLEITAAAINNVNIGDSINRAAEKVRGGKALSETLKGDPNFLPLVPDMLRIGEQSGAMEDMMVKTATYYEREVDEQIKSISTIIEPVLMVVLGVFAFIIVAAVLLPVYGLAGKSVI
ncbi:MAG TPA: type II secretion system F family protein [Candidatus Saccharimonadales bacterium]